MIELVNYVKKYLVLSSISSFILIAQEEILLRASEKAARKRSASDENVKAPKRCKVDNVLEANEYQTRPVPAWQKPITCFFSKVDGKDNSAEKTSAQAACIISTDSQEAGPSDSKEPDGLKYADIKSKEEKEDTDQDDSDDENSESKDDSDDEDSESKDDSDQDDSYEENSESDLDKKNDSALEGEEENTNEEYSKSEIYPDSGWEAEGEDTDEESSESEIEPDDSMYEAEEDVLEQMFEEEYFIFMLRSEEGNSEQMFDEENFHDNSMNFESASDINSKVDFPMDLNEENSNFQDEENYLESTSEENSKLEADSIQISYQDLLYGYPYQFMYDISQEPFIFPDEVNQHEDVSRSSEHSEIIDAAGPDVNNLDDHDSE